MKSDNAYHFSFWYNKLRVMQVKILLVEDNESIGTGLVYSFKQNGYDIIYKNNIKDSVNYLENNKVDLVILDISLPDGNGFNLFKDVIKDAEIPTIFLSARDSEDDIVNGLELGAYDYITKPFSTRELMARVNRVLSNKNKIIKVGDISFDMDKMEVTKNDMKINLTSLEMKILALFFTNLNRVITREYIIERIWEWTGNDVNDNTVTVYLKRIREKLDSDIILTIKGLGYRVDEIK